MLINANDQYFTNVFLTHSGDLNTDTSYATEQDACEEVSSGFDGLTYLHTLHVQKGADGKYRSDVIDLSPDADEDYHREVAAEMRRAAE